MAVTTTTSKKQATKGSSLAQDALKRFFRNPTAILGLSILALIILMTIFAPLLRPGDPLKSNLKVRQLPPGLTMSQADLDKKKITAWTYPFGTDVQGRDLLMRVLYGGRISLRAGLIAVIFSVSIGMILGLIAGFFGGWIDMVIVWLVDVLLAFPGILLAIALASALGAGTLSIKLPFLPFAFELSSIEKALIAISITQIPIFVRITRASVISLRESEFVHAAKSLGASPRRMMWLHVLPNGLSPILIQLTLSIGTVVLDMAALGFLGLGAQPPAPEWGAMISDGFGRFRSAPWLSIFPGLAIFLTVVGFNLLGDALRDVLDPRLKNVS